MNLVISPARICAFTAAMSLLHVNAAWAAEAALSGDLGIGASWSQSQIRGERERTSAMPYLDLEYGPAFARVDTFGVKVLPVAYGHIEVVGQYRHDGYKAANLGKRQDSLPFGMGTLQITPIGAFDVRVYHDFGKSAGTLWQARYLAELSLGRVTLYPEIGAEYQSRRYTRYYYGTTEADAATLARNYQPGSAVNVFAGLLIDTRITQHWYTHLYVRRTVVGDSVADSPLVRGKGRNTALLAAGYRF
ncbi:hypothetical protein ASC87_09510 [Rhizobacter sp. Root1221]|nr:hypothetical protein ASC87_09510 [Rhizobacter sp. Root1221]